MAKKLFVRFSTTQDEQAVLDFYEQNKHEFVFQRDSEVWRERISAGAVTIIEDENGKIVASSISYPITDENGVHQWTEIGSTRVSLDGIGLVTPLVSAQILRAWMLEPPDDRFVLEIISGNAHSAHVFEKMGATAFNIPPGLHDKVKATITSDASQVTVDWFQMGAETVPDLAKNIKNVTLKNKRTGEEYELDFSRCLLVTHFKKEVEDLAASNLGDVKKPDLKQGIASFKKKFQP